MMKKVFVSTIFGIMRASKRLVNGLRNPKSGARIFLCFFVLLVCGCSKAVEQVEQPGETAAEGHRRHKRTFRVNQREMMRDIDKALLLDEPSKLTDKRVP